MSPHVYVSYRLVIGQTAQGDVRRGGRVGGSPGTLSADGARDFLRGRMGAISHGDVKPLRPKAFAIADPIRPIPRTATLLSFR
jgi:hypothetical protein